MVKMKLKIDLDANKLKYTSVIRQSNGASIQEINKNIEENNTVIKCDYFDTNKLIEFQKIVDHLLVIGASVHLFQEDREVQIDYIRNLISSYEQIAKDREEQDKDGINEV